MIPLDSFSRVIRHHDRIADRVSARPGARLLKDFGGDRTPIARFAFLEDPTPPGHGAAFFAEAVERASQGIASTAEANHVGLVGPGGGDADVVERVVIGPGGAVMEPEAADV